MKNEKGVTEMEVMRKFIIELKPDESMKWAEAKAYKRVIDHCITMIYLNENNEDKVSAYRNVMVLCKRLGNLW